MSYVLSLTSVSVLIVFSNLSGYFYAIIELESEFDTESSPMPSTQSLTFSNLIGELPPDSIPDIKLTLCVLALSLGDIMKLGTLLLVISEA